MDHARTKLSSPGLSVVWREDGTEYAQFLCFLIHFVRRTATTHTPVRMLFKCGEFVTDCLWFELLMVLLACTKELEKHSLDTHWLNRLQRLIGCFSFFERESMSFERTPLRLTRSMLTEYVSVQRRRALFYMATRAAEGGHSNQELFGFYNAFADSQTEAENYTHPHHMSSIVSSVEARKLRLVVMRVWYKLLLQKGMPKQALRVLESEEGMENEARILRETITTDVVSKEALAQVPVLTPPRFSHTPFTKGFNPLHDLTLLVVFGESPPDKQPHAPPPPPPPPTQTPTPTLLETQKEEELIKTVVVVTEPVTEKCAN